MKAFCLILLSLVVLFACHKFACYKKNSTVKIENGNVYFEGFPDYSEIEGTPIKIKNKLYVARRLWIVDSLLIIKDSKTNDKHLHVFNLKDWSYITSLISKGEGPGELTSVSSAYIENRVIYVHDTQTQTVIAANLDSAFQNKSYFQSFKTINKQKSKALKITKINEWFVSDLIPAYENRFQVYDKNMEEIASFGAFPEIENKGNLDSIRFLVQVKGNLFQGNMITIPDRDLMIVSHPFIDLIEVFNVKTKENLFNIIGPEQNYPPNYMLREYGAGIPCKECKYAYTSVRFFDDKIYALYSGIKYSNRYADQSKLLFVFDLNGNPLRQINLNVSLTDFVLQKRNGILKMYGLSPDSEDASLYEFVIEE